LIYGVDPLLFFGSLEPLALSLAALDVEDIGMLQI